MKPLDKGSGLGFLYKNAILKPSTISQMQYVPEFIEAIRTKKGRDALSVYDIVKNTYFEMLLKGEAQRTATDIMNKISKQVTGSILTWRKELYQKLRNDKVKIVGGKNMTNEEYVRQLGMLYEKTLSVRKDDSYQINPPQMDKLINILDSFLSHGDGKIEPVKLIPREEHGGVTATFTVFDVYGENVKKFCDAISEASAITIDATSDGEVCISVTIPEVFTSKK
ncbi:MAG: hypothetical protein E7491_09085 [Ruminococcaceae bacterium]|nr:hypothetical protein [Oscillospiraceae bacterium]